MTYIDSEIEMQHFERLGCTGGKAVINNLMHFGESARAAIDLSP